MSALCFSRFKIFPGSWADLSFGYDIRHSAWAYVCSCGSSLLEEQLIGVRKSIMQITKLETWSFRKILVKSFDFGALGGLITISYHFKS